MVHILPCWPWQEITKKERIYDDLSRDLISYQSCLVIRTVLRKGIHVVRMLRVVLLCLVVAFTTGSFYPADRREVMRSCDLKMSLLISCVSYK